MAWFRVSSGLCVNPEPLLCDKTPAPDESSRGLVFCRFLVAAKPFQEGPQAPTKSRPAKGGRLPFSRPKAEAFAWNAKVGQLQNNPLSRQAEKNRERAEGQALFELSAGSLSRFWAADPKGGILSFFFHLNFSGKKFKMPGRASGIYSAQLAQCARDFLGLFCFLY